MPSLAPVSASFRGRGNLGRRRKCHTKRKASAAFQPSSRTTAGYNYLGSYSFPSCAPALSCEFPSACEVSLAPGGPPCGPRPSKLIKKGPSCTQPCTQAACSGLSANSAGNNLKRALEATGGDGRTPKSHKDLRAPKDLRAKVHSNASVSPMSSTTCVRGTGLCPLVGWTIDQYCPSCHG